MPRFLFTETELKRLSIPFPDRIAERIRARDLTGAILLTREMAQTRILLHDFYADTCTVLWSFIGERQGEAAMEPMFRYIFARSAARQFFDAAGAQVLPHLSVILLAKSWRAHSCFGKGEHPAGFAITEDDEKFSFHLQPCGSGGRLWRKGWYADGGGGKLSEAPYPWTYHRKNFPYYCIHCPFLNEILPYESAYGALLWPVDPPDTAFDTCAWHIYKNPNQIPESYYNRLGLARKPVATGPYRTRPGRYFSEDQLAEMCRPMTDRIIDALQQGESRNAIKLCRAVKDEFLVLHDLYVNMVAATLTFIAETWGEAALGKALDRQFEQCIRRQLIEKISEWPVREKTMFLADHIFGTDACNGCGYGPGKFTIAETGAHIRFSLHPCGSGGRLIRAGADKWPGILKRLRERLETVVITFAAHHFPLPEALIRWVFPAIVNHFTQRKPFGLGNTAEPHAWSFHRSGIPYFCCQCGMIQQKLGHAHLRILPPRSRRDACIWELRK